MSDFGRILREKRRVGGLSQRRLAELAGLDFSYISKLENGRLPPPAAETTARLARILGCPVEELLSAARKLPDGVGKALAQQPSALRFLREASQLGLSEDDWERMLGQLRSLGSHRGRKSGT